MHFASRLRFSPCLAACRERQLLVSAHAHGTTTKTTTTDKTKGCLVSVDVIKQVLGRREAGEFAWPLKSAVTKPRQNTKRKNIHVWRGWAQTRASSRKSINESDSRYKLVIAAYTQHIKRMQGGEESKCRERNTPRVTTAKNGNAKGSQHANS